MNSALPIEIETPTLNEYTFHLGNVQGTEPEAGMFAYNFKHWCFSTALNKKALATFKSLVNDILEYKLEQLLEDSEIWHLEGNWMDKLPHRFHALVVKNLQKAMNTDNWHMESDMFMEDALHDILNESFNLSADHEDHCGERNKWISVFKSIGYKEKEVFENETSPDELWWDLDFEMLSPNKKAVQKYCEFLLKAY